MISVTWRMYACSQETLGSGIVSAMAEVSPMNPEGSIDRSGEEKATTTV